MGSKSSTKGVLALVAVVGLMALLSGISFAQTSTSSPRPKASDTCDWGGHDGSTEHPCRPSPSPTGTETSPYPGGGAAVGVAGDEYFVSDTSPAESTTNILAALGVLGGMVVLCVMLISRTGKEPSKPN